jgi:hypothetical protein
VEPCAVCCMHVQECVRAYVCVCARVHVRLCALIATVSTRLEY